MNNYEKIQEIIESCKTIEHLESAKTYVDLYLKHCNNEQDKIKLLLELKEKQIKNNGEFRSF